MSKRITLTDFEVEQIVSGLKTLRNDIAPINNEVIKVGQRFYDGLIAKLQQQKDSPKDNPHAK